jgi:hypothetical protein
VLVILMHSHGYCFNTNQCGRENVSEHLSEVADVAKIPSNPVGCVLHKAHKHMPVVAKQNQGARVESIFHQPEITGPIIRQPPPN